MLLEYKATLLGLLLLTLCNAPVFAQNAQNSTQKDILAEFSELFSSSSTDVPTRMYYEWEVDIYPRPFRTGEDVYPQGLSEAAARNRAEAGVITHKSRLWLWSDDLWRYSGDGGQEYPGQLPWSDVMCNGRMGATISDQFAVIIDPTNPPPDQGREIVSSRWRTVQSELGNFFSQGVGAWASMGIEPVSAVEHIGQQQGQEENTWSGVGRSGTTEISFSGDFVGNMDAEENMRVRSFTTIQHAMPEAIGKRTTYGNYAPVDGASVPIPTVVTTFQKDGRPYRALRFVTSRPITSRTEVERITQMPVQGYDDAVRGELTFSALVADYRPDKGTQWQRMGEVEQTLAIAPSQLPASRFNWRTLIGFILAGVIVAGIVAWRFVLRDRAAGARSH